MYRTRKYEYMANCFGDYNITCTFVPQKLNQEKSGEVLSNERIFVQHSIDIKCLLLSVNDQKFLINTKLRGIKSLIREKVNYMYSRIVSVFPHAFVVDP